MPSPQNGESFDAPAETVRVNMNENEIEVKFAAIEREAVRQAFNQITQDLEMSLSGYESREVPVIEIAPTHPVAVELLHIGRSIEMHREKHNASLVEQSRLRHKIGRVISLLITNSPSDIVRPVEERTIEHESKIGAALFPVDTDVTSRKFFFLPAEDPTTKEIIHMWHHDQKSTIPSKNFTNTYKIKDSGIEKSSTYFDERLARTVNRSSIPGAAEMSNLLMASKKYYSAVTEKVYIKPAAPRFRFGSKSDHDLAA